MECENEKKKNEQNEQKPKNQKNEQKVCIAVRASYMSNILLL